MKKVHGSVIAMLIAIFLGALVSISAPAFAHKVTIFAWVEGDRVFTESKFSGGRRATSAEVAVFDRGGTQLLEGTTDGKGEFSFRIPKLTDLRIVLNAGTGHRAEWTITESEIRQAGYQEGIQEVATPRRESVDRDLRVEEIQELIDESLDRRLTPIVKMLADLQTKGPSTTEVIGGIGYIVGLMGLALYFLSRRKKEGGKDHD
jgi:nickel transport protein